MEQKIADQSLKATEVYAEAVSASRALHAAAQNPAAGPHPLPRDLILKILALLESGNQELLALADRSTPDNYLPAHAVNVTIFSLRLGMAVSLPPEDLSLLGLGAFLHDLGMTACLPLALKAALLTDEERALVRNHPRESQKLLAAHFPGLPHDTRARLQDIVGQVHERAEGTGYPEGRRSDDIHRLAKIIGACDVYEAVTHPRAWRSRILPHNALRHMIQEHEKAFEPGIIKTLIEALSLYPPGSFVRLSSGEIGRVVFTNPGLPTRPKVKLLLDAQGGRLPKPRIVNLATQPILYVAEAVDETALKTPDQRLLLELRAQRWWVRGL